jgi:hypothetical protein
MSNYKPGYKTRIAIVKGDGSIKEIEVGKGDVKTLLKIKEARESEKMDEETLLAGMALKASTLGTKFDKTYSKGISDSKRLELRKKRKKRKKR